MGTYFLDTSAIVKRYVPAEQGYAWVGALCHPAQGHKLFISQAVDRNPRIRRWRD